MVTILEDSNPFKEIFQTTTLVVIFITVFIQGSTIKPLVNILNIQKKEDDTVQRRICEDVNEKLIDHLMTGVESVVGRKMSRYRVLNFITNFEKAYLRRILIKKGAEDPLTLKLQKISLNEHYARLYGPAIMVAQDKGQDFLENDQEQQSVQMRPKSTENRVSRRISRILSIKSSSPPPDEVEAEQDMEREALLKSFNENAFDKFSTKKFEMDDEDQVKCDLENMVEKRTKMLWKIAMKATISHDRNSPDRDEEEIQVLEGGQENVHELIKEAYEKVKHDTQ